MKMMAWCHRLCSYGIVYILLIECVTMTACFAPIQSQTALTSDSVSTPTTTNSQRRRIQPKFDIRRHYAIKKKYNQNLGTFEKLDIKAKSNLKSNEGEEQQQENNDRIVKLYDFSSSDPIKFQLMWDIQKDIVEAHVQRLKVEFERKQPASQFWLMEEIFDTSAIDDEVEIKDKQKKRLMIDESYRTRGCDSIIILQHQPVYTLGTASDKNFIKLVRDNIDVVRIERGGEVTYHGPGQLTVYPILDLRGYKQDIHWYMRALEEAALLSLQRVGIVGATREDDVTGVWVNGKKIAAIGVKVRRWVTMHGIAINVDQRSLQNFDGIVPCGLEGRDVCCINDFLEAPISMDEFANHFKLALEEIFEIKILK